jgi:uncharacterized protein (TIGR03437 family)
LALANGVTVNTIDFGLSFTANGQAPAPTTKLKFTDTTACAVQGGSPCDSLNGTTATQIAPVWTGLSPVLSGNSTLGSVTMTVPAGAVGGQTYTAVLTGVSASVNSTAVSVSITNGSQTITVPSVLTISSPANNTALTAGTQGAAYTQTITATGGTAPDTWSVTGLPAGLSINANTGVISGTPTANGTFNTVKVTVLDSETPAVSVTDTYSLVISPPLSNITGTITGTEGTALGANSVTVTGGLGPYTWSAPTLATYGLSISTPTNAASTSVTGTPNTPANAVGIPLTVTDANGAVLNGSITLTVNGPLTITSTQASLPTGTVSVGYPGTGQVSTVSASGGTLPYTWTVAAGSASPLPAGLGISTNGSGQGVISGTPTAATTAVSVTLQVKDSAGSIKTQTYTIAVDPALTVSAPATIPGGEQGVKYPASITATATGGSGTFTWTISGEPTGLTIGASSGTISGTPTQSGNFNITVTATDATYTFVTASKTYSNVSFAAGVTITGPAAGALTNGTVGIKYGANGAGVSITTAGGSGSFTWSISAGSLPTGLSLGMTGANNITGTITGTPTTVATSTFTVQVVDANQSTATQQYTIQVYAAPSLTLPATLPTATVGSSYPPAGSPINLVETGGAPTLQYTATGLPNGLSINKSTGAITGTPAAGTATPQNTPDSVQVTVTDGNLATSKVTATLTVDPALTLTPSPGTLPVAVPGVAYSQTFTPTGGSGAGYNLTLSGLTGTGLTFSGGKLSGTPSANATPTNNLVATLTDSTGATATFNYTLVVAPPLTIPNPTAPPAGTVKVAYVTYTISAAGGTKPYNWSATNLPPGLNISTLNGNGVINGTPTALAGSPYSVKVTVTDANGTTASVTYSIVIGALPLQIMTGLLPKGVVNVPYPFTSIVAQGGVGNYSWTITGLPPGLTTDGNGNISGTPTSAVGSPFSVVVTVTDATQKATSETYSVAISNVLTVAIPTTLPAAILNAPYTPTTVIAGGGLAPYTWVATGLPAGLTIGIATGIISGTPTSATGSPYSVTVTVTDSTGKTASMNYSLTVGTGVTITGPASLPVATLGSAYTSTTITAAGGSGVYTWSATGLPAGLSIGATTGAISGTPTSASGSPYSVTATVTDTSSNTATKTYTLTVNQPSGSPTITSVSTAAGGQLFIGPNMWVSIYGTGFTTAGFTDNWTISIKNSATGALPTTLDNVSVMIGGLPAYIYYISATQINVLTPNIGFGSLAVMVTNGTGSSNVVMSTSQGQDPAFFEWANAAGQTPGDTSQQPVATHADYSPAAANGTFGTTASIPAAPGETIVLWGAGFGATTPANPFGVAIPSTGSYTTTQNVTVLLNNAPITVLNNNAILTPGDAGLYQMAVTIPTTLPNGTYPISVSVNGVTSPTLSLAVHN